MFTQCPECQTVFRLRLEQLKAAGGKVRCSRCATVFDAIDNRPGNTSAQAHSTGMEDEAGGEINSISPTPNESSVSSSAAQFTADTAHTPANHTGEESPQPEAEKDAIPPAVEEESSDIGMASPDEPPMGDELDLAAWDEEPTLPEAEEETVEVEAIPATDEPADDELDLAAWDEESPLPEVEEEPVAAEATPATDEPADDELDLATWDEASPLPVVEEEPVAAEAPPAADESTNDELDLAAWNEESPLPEAEEEPVEVEATPAADEPADDELDLAAWDEESPLPEVEEEPVAVEAPPAADESTNDELDLAAWDEEPTLPEVEEEPVTVDAPPAAVESTDDELDLAAWDEEPTLPEAEEEPVEVEAPPAADEPVDDEIDLANWQAEPVLPEEDEASSDNQADLLHTTPERYGEPDAQADNLDDFSQQLLAGFEQQVTAEPEQAPGATDNTDWDPFSEQHIENLLSPAGEDISFEDTNVQAPVEEPAPAEDKIQETEPAVADRLDEDEELLNQLLPEEDDDLEQELGRLQTRSKPEYEKNDSQQAHNEDEVPPPPNTYSLGLEESTTQSSSLFSGLLWAGGILLLLASLALQFIYYHHQQLAAHTQLRPMLEYLCDWGDCELPLQRDLGQIRLLSHMVQFHPRYQDSLLITATLINRAEFTQVYPEVELQMTDLQQRVIASRRFKPEEYLVAQANDGLMPRNIEIPLMLEVVDPGNEVVGFRFEFH